MTARRSLPLPAIVLAYAASAAAAPGLPAGQHRAAPDSLSWLGPLPASISSEDLERGWRQLQARFQDDMDRRRTDVQAFSCRAPQQVGPVPMMDDVDRYVGGYPRSASDPVLVDRLHRAAAAGNWLARGWLLGQLASQPMRSPAEHYRLLQLAESLRAARIGPVYRWYAAHYVRPRGDRQGADELDIHAALLDSYPAQLDVGAGLVRDPSPARAAAGRRMLACALSASPGYRQLLGTLPAAHTPIWTDPAPAPPRPADYAPGTDPDRD